MEYSIKPKSLGERRIIHYPQKRIIGLYVKYMNEYFPTVVQVIPLDNYHVQVFFDDGKIVDYDTTQDLKSSIFEPLRDIENFKNACTVMNGTLAWDISGKMDESDCIDIDPFTLYELKAINSLIA